jgi:hypothetical protein
LAVGVVVCSLVLPYAGGSRWFSLFQGVVSLHVVKLFAMFLYTISTPLF